MASYARVVLEADVVVVGGGPAGAAAAITLATAGRDVVVVDRARFPSPPAEWTPVAAIADIREQPRRHGSAKRIFHSTEVSDDSHIIAAIGSFTRFRLGPCLR